VWTFLLSFYFDLSYFNFFSSLLLFTLLTIQLSDPSSPLLITVTMTSTSTTPTNKIQEDVQVAETKPVNKTIAQIRSFAAGGAGGVCAVVVGHPFDLVKVRLQTAQRGVYSSAMDVVRKTVAREGLVRVCQLAVQVLEQRELTII